MCGIRLEHCMKMFITANVQINVFTVSRGSYVFCVGTDIVGSFRVVCTFCQPFLNHLTVCRGMIFYATLKTKNNQSLHVSLK